MTRLRRFAIGLIQARGLGVAETMRKLARNPRRLARPGGARHLPRARTEPRRGAPFLLPSREGKRRRVWWMTRIVAWLLSGLVLGLASAASSADDDLDRALARVIAARDLKPLETPAFVPSAKFRLGQMLFFDPILSGTRDVACATCHLLGHGTSDAVPLSIGVRATGLAEARRPRDRPRVHPRNSIDIWNRGHPSVRNMFWDGRVTAVNAPVTRFRSPMGDFLPEGMESVLAVQALLPLAGEEEMLGLPDDRSAPDLPPEHADRPNEIAEAARGLDDGPERIVAVHDAIMRRLLGTVGTPLADWQIAYRRLLGAAYPDTLLGAITIGDIGNAIGHFQTLAFATRDTPWDRYLAGEAYAIGDQAKRGALLFHGKGRCVACHGGPLFSDFQFHALAVPQIGPGIDDRGDDRGRYEATRIPRHRYQFRTPPLRNVTLTAPYFHDGAAASLAEAIAAHRRPSLPRRPPLPGGPPGGAGETARRASFTPILARWLPPSPAEQASLIAFLKSLEDPQAERRARIVPARVPSGLAVPAIDGAS